MGRFVVIRDEENGGERLVEESAVPTEAALHEVLMRHPSLVPATDLGFGRVVTVGFEASLASGSADLVLLDEEGRICIVEVKKEGNPDTRRVVAQLLDYAAALWGLTVEEFERVVLRRKLGAADSRSLRDYITDELLADEEDPQEGRSGRSTGWVRRCAPVTLRWSWQRRRSPPASSASSSTSMRAPSPSLAWK
jgi:hypothetical protein